MKCSAALLLLGVPALSCSLHSASDGHLRSATASDEALGPGPTELPVKDLASLAAAYTDPKMLELMALSGAGDTMRRDEDFPVGYTLEWVELPAVRVADARVVWCDDALLRRDFGDAVPSAGSRDLEEWILSFARVHALHTLQVNANTGIRLWTRDDTELYNREADRGPTGRYLSHGEYIDLSEDQYIAWKNGRLLRKNLVRDVLDEPDLPARYEYNYETGRQEPVPIPPHEYAHLLDIRSTHRPIHRGTFERTVHANYGRAHIDELGAGGAILDAKGSGGINPKHVSPHNQSRTGLLPLAQALRDLFLQQMLQAVYIREKRLRESACGGQNHFFPTTVQTYCVLDLGFNIKRESPDQRPWQLRAGMLLRQAHHRSPFRLPNSEDLPAELRPPSDNNLYMSEFDSFREAHRRAVGEALIPYAIHGHAAGRPRELPGTNLQFSFGEWAIYDFGTVGVLDEEHRTLHDNNPRQPFAIPEAWGQQHPVDSPPDEDVAPPLATTQWGAELADAVVSTNYPTWNARQALVDAKLQEELAKITRRPAWTQQTSH